MTYRLPADAVPFTAAGECPVCGKAVNVAGAWRRAWGPRPALLVAHLPDGSHRPEWGDAVPISPGILRRQERRLS